jgi:hypothetical protein
MMNIAMKPSVSPHAKAEEGDQNARVHDERVSEERFPREHRDDLRHDAESREEQDVDFRVPEDPEQVLPEQHVSARQRIEEQRAEHAVEHQKDETDCDRREGYDQQERRDQRHPGKQGHAHERHALGTQVDDRHDEVQRPSDRRHAEDHQAEHPEIDAHPRRILRRSQIGVAEPARVRRAAEQKAGVHEQSAEEEQPETERVQTWERHVPGADLQRDNEIEEGRAERHDGEEHHGRAVHRE